MRIKKVRIENFKCFKAEEIEFGKLTILTGANSSGKSSSIYSILGPLQSFDFPFNFSTNGKYVNMGDYEDIAYLHNKAIPIKIGFNIEDKSEITLNTTWVQNKENRLPQLLSLTAETNYYKLTININENENILEFTYNQDNDPTINDSFALQIKIQKLLRELNKPNSEGQKQMDSTIAHLEKTFKKNNQKIKISFKNINTLGEEIHKKGSYALFTVYNSLSRLFKEIDKQHNYISSFRFHPQKQRFEISKSDLTVGKYGDNYEDQLVYWETQKTSEFESLKKLLSDLKILIDIKTKRLTGGTYELRVKTHPNGVYSSLTDVGFGISQFLPIIVSDMQLGNNSTLFISQPEIHLHPSVQSDFGNYLNNQIITKGKKYVIETHSEYFLNKVRSLIVHKKLKVEDVKIYYFQKNKNKVVKHELTFTDKGEIKNAPDEFFDTYMTDVMDIALNA